MTESRENFCATTLKWQTVSSEEKIVGSYASGDLLLTVYQLKGAVKIVPRLSPNESR